MIAASAGLQGEQGNECQAECELIHVAYLLLRKWRWNYLFLTGIKLPLAFPKPNKGILT